MPPDLPAALAAALDRALDGVGRKDLAERARRTSEAYRAGRGSETVIREADDALAYGLTRLPATYAACASAFAATAAAVPGFRPARLLDAGVGPGAASWAATATWPTLGSAVWLDSSATFLALAQALAAEGPAALRRAEIHRADLTSEGPWPQADLVTASYALAEIAPARQAATVAALWAACDGLLVLVEPGTPAGHRRLLAARQALLAAGAAVLAPCPHAQACPLAEPDWCHFNVRLPRSRAHRLVKGADAPFEDEKFAYLAVARPQIATLGAGAERSARVLAHPQAGKPGVSLKLCRPDGGLERRVVSRRDKPAHARARRVAWGDVWD
jgi:ribosomal protein RSM22 (predicted rRNA methylase)